MTKASSPRLPEAEVKPGEEEEAVVQMGKIFVLVMVGWLEMRKMWDLLWKDAEHSVVKEGLARIVRNMAGLAEVMQRKVNGEGQRLLRRMGHPGKVGLLRRRVFAVFLKGKRMMAGLEEELLVMTDDPRVSEVDRRKVRRVVEGFNQEWKELMAVKVEDL